MERRLSRLDTLARRRAPQPVRQTYDMSALDTREQYELDQLLAKLQGLAPLPNGEQDLGVFSDDELDRLAELAAKLEGIEMEVS